MNEYPEYDKKVEVTVDGENWFTAIFGDYFGECYAWQSTSDNHPK